MIHRLQGDNPEHYSETRALRCVFTLTLAFLIRHFSHAWAVRERFFTGGSVLVGALYR